MDFLKQNTQDRGLLYSIIACPLRKSNRRENKRQDLNSFANDWLDDCYAVYREVADYVAIEKAYSEAWEVLYSTLTDTQQDMIRPREDTFNQREGYSTTMAYLQGLKDGLKLDKI